MKMYLVQENELKTISVFNSQMTLWSSIGTGALALVVACLWDLVTSDVDSRTGVVFCIATLLVAAISGGIVRWNYSSRNALLTEIQEATNAEN